MLTVGLLLIGPVQAQSPAELPTVSVPTLTLRDALNIAARNSVTLKQSRADASAVSASAESARAQERPTLSTTTYGTVGDSSNILTTSPGVSPQNLFVVAPRGFADQNLMLMVPLFTGGRLEGASASAQKQGEAAELSVQAARLTVADTVTEDYAAAALRQALVGVAQARLDAEDEQVRVTQEKVITGRLAPVDLLREQAEQADARQSLLEAQNDAAEATDCSQNGAGGFAGVIHYPVRHARHFGGNHDTSCHFVGGTPSGRHPPSGTPGGPASGGSGAGGS